MLIRLLALVALVLIPLSAPISALADDATIPSDTPAAATTPAPTDQPASSSSPGSLLGPSSINSGAGGSTTDSTALQPAGQSPLQSTTSDANGLTAPNGSPLQAPASSDNTLKVIMGDADGSPVQVAGTSSAPSPGAWLALSVLFGLIVTLLSLYYRRLNALFSPAKKLLWPRRRLHRK